MRYTDQRVLSVDNRAIKKYTVNFSGSNPAGTRADDAVGMVAGVAVGSGAAVNNFDAVSFFNRPICCGNFDANGVMHINAYRGEPGFAWDGSNGELWHEETPFYWKGDLLTTVSVTGTPCEGYELSPRFPNGTDKQYSPVYWMASVNNVATSRSGVFPTYNSLNGHMTAARTYNATKAHTETMAARMSDYILQLVEFATKDVQNIMMGACNLSYTASHVATVAENGVNRIIIANAYADTYVVGQTIAIGASAGDGAVCENRVITTIAVYDANNKAISFDGAAVNIALGKVISSRAWKNGATDIITASSGSPVSNTSGKYPCIWRGKVDPWADAFSAICDILIQQTGSGTTGDPYVYTPYYLKDPRKYNAGTITADYVKLGYTIPGADGYAETLGYDARYKLARLTDAIGASSTTYLAAYYYYPRYAVCVAFVGGGWISGRYCSPVYFYCNNAPSYSNINRLARHFYRIK
jgi:hypothetical protein